MGLSYGRRYAIITTSGPHKAGPNLEGFKNMSTITTSGPGVTTPPTPPPGFVTYALAPYTATAAGRLFTRRAALVTITTSPKAVA